jgi:hypothetical protein
MLNVVHGLGAAVGEQVHTLDGLLPGSAEVLLGDQARR